MYVKGAFEPYNVSAIVKNVTSVFKHQDISKLQGPAYKFITLHMGFIAHYNIHGFRGYYTNMEDFAEALVKGEHYTGYRTNLAWADHYGRDPFFTREYGRPYVESVVAGIRGIVDAAEHYQRQEKAPQV